MLAQDYSQSIHSFNLFLSWKIQPFFQLLFRFGLWQINPSSQSFLLLKNPTVVLRIFWPWIIANLSIVLIISSTGKSDGRFANFLTLGYSQSIHSLNLFCSWKIEPLFKQYIGLQLLPVCRKFQSFFSRKYQPLLEQYFGLGLQPIYP